MAYVVGEPCHNCKYGDCVEVCPVDCFYQTETTLLINPDECILCDACRPACPVEAIFSEDDGPVYDNPMRPADHYVQLARQFTYAGRSPVTRKADVQHGPGWDPAKATG